MFWYIIGYIVIGFIGGSLFWGMFNEKKYSYYYNEWYNTEDAGVVILLSAIWPLTLAVLILFLLVELVIKIFEIIANIGHNITH